MLRTHNRTILVVLLAVLSLGVPGFAIATSGQGGARASEPSEAAAAPDGHGHSHGDDGAAPAVAAASAPAGDHDHGRRPRVVPPDEPERGLVYDGLVAPETGPCAGMFEVEAVDGMCTHGPDAPFLGTDVYAASEPVSVADAGYAGATAAAVCDGDGTSGKRVEVLYVREAGTADRHAEYLGSFRTWIAGVDEIYGDSAAQTGGTRRVRWVTDASCNVVVRNVEVPAGSLDDVSSGFSAVRQAGFDRTDRKYLMFADANVLCGVATVTGDTRPGADNPANRGPSYGRVDTGCWNAQVAAHELTHEMGSVFSSAPNATTNGHCTDDYDVMCYDDGGGTPRIVCPDRAAERLLDCNKDDYFSTAPVAGSWLASNWNVADNEFLVAGGGTTPPPDPTGEVVTLGASGGRCVDVRFGNQDDGALVQLFQCNDTPAQEWTQPSDGSLRAFGKCLDTAGGATAAGSRTVIRTCTGAATQQWERDGDAFVQEASGRCLDVPGTAADWTPLVIAACSGAADQQWAVS